MGQIADLIRRVLDGEEPPEALGKYWAHDMTMPIYERSCHILSMPKDTRRSAINDNPPEIAKLLAAEVKRLYILRTR